MAAESDPFRSYTQLPSRVPRWLWDVASGLSVLASLLVVGLLIVAPSEGLKLWWGLLVPCLPLVWFTIPGLWRNVCPLAAVNQLPRRMQVTFAVTAPEWWKEYAPVVGMFAFLTAIAARPLFNTNAQATAALVGLALAFAFVGGVVLKGKSGWCSSLCPMLPVQRLYGQTPFVTVPNSHCRPCVGCTKNCYDFNPRVAWLADLHDEDQHWTAYRLFFTGAFLGVVVAYFNLPPELPRWESPVWFLIAVILGVGSFHILHTFVRVSPNKLTALYAAAAISIVYWYASPILATTLLGDEHHWSIWILRGFVWSLALLFVWRTWRKEAVFLERALDPGTVRFGNPNVMRTIRHAQAGSLEVTFADDGVRVVAKPGQSLLEIVEGSDGRIESGCRMGVCGADPICIRAGMNNLSAPTKDEQATLDRLGLAASTRMACCAKVRGPVTISLTPERVAIEVPKGVSFEFDPAVKRVVVLGNGVAGVTAADHVRRRHPDCAIDLVGGEPHPFYNRMGITRLIYGRSAMVGLQLLPDAWYEHNRITTWLNTCAVAIDRSQRVVELGTREMLGYDRLILALGSEALVPRLEGYGMPGTFVLRRAAPKTR